MPAADAQPAAPVPACTCGACPAARATRGLSPFCHLPRTAAPTDRRILATYESARAHYGKTVSLVRVRSGVGHGPGRWVPAASYGNLRKADAVDGKAVV